ncbi:MAG: DHHA1 domain-containing protein, partial [bacterium]
HHRGRTCMLICDRRLLDKYGGEAAEMEGLVNYSLYTRGVQVGVLLREFESERIKVSLRSQSSFDVAALARRFSGGGHPTASGCNVPQPLAETRQTLLDLIKEGLPA